VLWELILLIVSITVLCGYSLARDLYVFWRNQQRADALGRALRALEGQPAWDAEKRFGAPTEVVEGTSGRSLHIWKGERLPGVPPGAGLLVVTLTIEAGGLISGAHWQQRGGE
jgi:hypothetical protein